MTHIDHTDRRIYLDRDKEQVKGSPDSTTEHRADFRADSSRVPLSCRTYYGDTASQAQ